MLIIYITTGPMSNIKENVLLCMNNMKWHIIIIIIITTYLFLKCIHDKHLRV